jgi:threonine dehydrogenase-like Zn-dependent dehydrogenase
VRAVVLREGRLEVRDTTDPVPGPGELLVRVLSTAICASDVHYMDHPEVAINDASGLSAYDEARDIVLGHEFVGEVVAHGPGCTDQFPVGARVTSMPMLLTQGGMHIIGQHPDAPGSFGELMLFSEALTRQVPDGVPIDAVALVDAFAVGEYYVRSSAIRDDELPLVIGAGAIGLSAVAALARRGIAPILVSDYNAERRALAQQFGAHVVVDAGVHAPFDAWREVARDRGITSPPVVFECVGAPGLVQQLVESCEMWTRLYVAGAWYTADTINCTDAARKGVTIQFGGGPLPDDWYGTLEAVCDGRLDPLPSVGRIIGLDEVPEALELARRAQGPPRIIVHPNPT